MRSKKCVVPSAWCLVPGSSASAGVIDSPAERAKKREAKKRKFPLTPLREKAKGKEIQTGFLKETVCRAQARGRARARGAACPAAVVDAELDMAVSAFGGDAEDRRIWAAIAWRVGAEEFHYAVLEKMSEDAADGPARNPAAAFQAFLNRRFPKPVKAAAGGEAAEGGAA